MGILLPQYAPQPQATGNTGSRQCPPAQGARQRQPGNGGGGRQAAAGQPPVPRAKPSHHSSPHSPCIPPCTRVATLMPAKTLIFLLHIWLNCLYLIVNLNVILWMSHQKQLQSKAGTSDDWAQWRHMSNWLAHVTNDATHFFFTLTLIYIHKHRDSFLAKIVLLGCCLWDGCDRPKPQRKSYVPDRLKGDVLVFWTDWTMQGQNSHEEPRGDQGDQSPFTLSAANAEVARFVIGMKWWTE